MVVAAGELDPPHAHSSMARVHRASKMATDFAIFKNGCRRPRGAFTALWDVKFGIDVGRKLLGGLFLVILG